MTLGNMRELVCSILLASCLNDACRHQALIDVSNYPPDRSAVVRKQGEVRQVRRPRQQDRRAPELEAVLPTKLDFR
jgi:hypothetical protein